MPASAANVKSPAIQGLAFGLNKGHAVTKNVRKEKQARRRGQLSKKTRIVRELVREVTGFAPYERRVLELLRIRHVPALPLFRNIPLTEYLTDSALFQQGQEGSEVPEEAGGAAPASQEEARRDAGRPDRPAQAPQVSGVGSGERV